MSYFSQFLFTYYNEEESGFIGHVGRANRTLDLPFLSYYRGEPSADKCYFQCRINSSFGLKFNKHDQQKLLQQVLRVPVYHNFGGSRGWNPALSLLKRHSDGASFVQYPGISHSNFYLPLPWSLCEGERGKTRSKSTERSLSNTGISNFSVTTEPISIMSKTTLRHVGKYMFSRDCFLASGGLSICYLWRSPAVDNHSISEWQNQNVNFADILGPCSQRPAV